MSSEKANNNILRLDAETLFLFLIILLPISIKVFLPIISTVVIFPSEILIGLVALLFVYQAVISKKYPELNREFFLHPITLSIICYISITLLSTLFSTFFLVSLKATIVKVSYIVVFYSFSYIILIRNINNYFSLLKYYGFSLIIVAIYTLANQSQLGFNRNGAGFACHPFYNDHTLYSACLVFILPVFFNEFIKVRAANERIIFFIGFVLLLTTFYFSFCRAAWISVLIAVFFLFLIYLGMRFKTFIILISLLTFGAITLYRPALNYFQNNKVDSNKSNAGLYEHVFSVTNITNDVSNKERLNRWRCSYKMFKEHPLLGFGPGTYQFNYIPYQNEADKSYVSLNKPLRPGFGSFYWHSNAAGLIQDKDYTYYQGAGGTAHSEYLLELSESGIFGFLFFCMIFTTAIYTAFIEFKNPKGHDNRHTLFIVFFSLAAYSVHGVFNNFLDDCKLSFLFWVTISLITAISNKKDEELTL